MAGGRPAESRYRAWRRPTCRRARIWPLWLAPMAAPLVSSQFGAASGFTLNGITQVPERVAFSPSGTAAALASAGRVLVVTGLPDAPALAARWMPAGRRARSPSATTARFYCSPPAAPFVAGHGRCEPQVDGCRRWRVGGLRSRRSRRSRGRPAGAGGIALPRCRRRVHSECPRASR